MTKSLPAVLGRIALIVVGVLVLALAWLWWLLPRGGADRLDAGAGVVGVEANGSYAWIVRTANGAVLVDAGLDPDAGAILRELQRQGLRPDQVHAVLLTHAHPDHWVGTRVFPQAEVYLGEADLPILRGEREVTAPLPKLLAKVMPAGAPPAKVAPVEHGQTLEVDGRSFKAVHTPGHTPGSTMFLLDDLLFTGDSLLARDGELMVAPSLLSEDRGANVESLEKLRELPFTRIADGHTGLHDAAPAKLGRLLE